MLQQLLNLLETKGFGDKLRSTSATNSQGDDGKHYAQALKGLLQKDCNSHSLTFNTDGVQLFKSVSLSIWPLQSFKIASERRTNLMFSGLWLVVGNYP